MTLSRLRLSTNREYYYEVDYLDKVSGIGFRDYTVEVLDANGEWKQVAGTWYINNKLNKARPARGKAVAEINRLARQLGDEGPRNSFVGRFIEPKRTYVLHRGSPESPTAEVMPSGPEILSGDLGFDSTTAGADRRRGFAEWMIRPDHPLTSRVMVNRIWHHVFGTGIVSTTSDFGTAGAAPSHPELLDWLAAEFVVPASGTSKAAKPWSVKSMLRLLLTSDAFRRSNVPTEVGISKDAGGRLLWRFPPRRVEAEVIRDSILQASGSLDPKQGGRGYRIHNVKKTYAQWEVVNNHGPETWRRMLYQERMRRVDDRMFTAFDFPDCGQIRAKRPVSTTPLQALNLMNSPFVVEQAQRMADRSQNESGGSSVASVRKCFQLLLNRDPNADELAACVSVTESAGLHVVCRSLMNSNEFAFLP